MAFTRYLRHRGPGRGACSRAVARVVRPLVAAAAAALIAAPASGQADDYWLVPQPLLSTVPPEEVPIRLYAGDGLVVADEKAMQLDRVARFLHVHEGAREDLLRRAAGGAQGTAARRDS